MSQQDEKQDEIEDNQKKRILLSEEHKRFQEIADLFNQTIIQGNQSRIQSPLLNSEIYSNHLKQFNKDSNQSNIVQIDKRFLLPEDANYITYLSENSKLLKEKYVQHCMDSVQSIQEFVLNQRSRRKNKYSNFEKNDVIDLPQVNNQINLQNIQQCQQLISEVNSSKKLSNSNKPNIQKLYEDPELKEKFSIVSKILEILNEKKKIQSTSQKISILEDALILCLVFLQLSNFRQGQQEWYSFIQKNYNYQRSFQSFVTRIKVQRNLYDQWTLQNLDQLYKVLKEYPIDLLENLPLIQQNSITLPKQS
ncbi:unnamed protein product [Paramecium pentaurelia]|uniref:Uncharacterized protein n=1 Tax=Paramecium pentaurelia TaxID=43138 RepID=A0A8S1TKB9_9CILI|nr:unnamed protein product [Paramecium pentaurelia]